jgi:hypothetical protein
MSLDDLNSISLVMSNALSLDSDDQYHCDSTTAMCACIILSLYCGVQHKNFEVWYQVRLLKSSQNLPILPLQYGIVYNYCTSLYIFNNISVI